MRGEERAPLVKSAIDHLLDCSRSLETFQPGVLGATDAVVAVPVAVSHLLSSPGVVGAPVAVVAEQVAVSRLLLS